MPQTDIGISPETPYLMRVVDAEQLFAGGHTGVVSVENGLRSFDFRETRRNSGLVVMSIKGPNGGFRETVELKSSEVRQIMVKLNGNHRRAFRGESAFILAADR